MPCGRRVRGSRTGCPRGGPQGRRPCPCAPACCPRPRRAGSPSHTSGACARSWMTVSRPSCGPERAACTWTTRWCRRACGSRARRTDPCPKRPCGGCGRTVRQTRCSRAAALSFPPSFPLSSRRRLSSWAGRWCGENASRPRPFLPPRPWDRDRRSRSGRRRCRFPDGSPTTRAACRPDSTPASRPTSSSASGCTVSRSPSRGRSTRRGCCWRPRVPPQGSARLDSS